MMSSEKTNKHNPEPRDEEIELFDKLAFWQTLTSGIQAFKYQQVNDETYEDALNLEFQGLSNASVSDWGIFSDTKQTLKSKNDQNRETGSKPVYPLSLNLQAELDAEVNFHRTKGC